MAKTSAGILLYRRREGAVEVLLAHMGGPFWAGREEGAWTLPKGEHGDDERPLDAARREFEEELGLPPPEPAQGGAVDLGSVRQSGGKVVTAFAIEGDIDAGAVTSNTVSLEWPRGSGRTVTFPEVDRAAWFTVDEARPLLVKAQALFLDRLTEAIGMV
jgi:predicted NUDIX family NTP pyrophosphohydrolase